MTDVLLHPPPAALRTLLSTLEPTRLQRDLARLCSVDFGGRRIGTDGHDRAAAWLGARLDELGLAVEPFDFTLALPVLALSHAPSLAIQEKSYGRAPTFLLLTGYEQVRSVVAALVGDWASARDVQLVLPETGVCSTDRGAGGGCCAPALAVPTSGATLELVPLSAAALPRAGGLTVLPLSAVSVASACCAPAAQATCCAPEEKADCCGTDGTSCGCDA